jgi:hypothetical protein
MDIVLTNSAGRNHYLYGVDTVPRIGERISIRDTRDGTDFHCRVVDVLYYFRKGTGELTGPSVELTYNEIEIV